MVLSHANLTMRETQRGRFTLQRLPFKNVNDNRDQDNEATSDYSLSPNEDEPNVLLPFLSNYLQTSGAQEGENAARAVKKFLGHSLNLPKIRPRSKLMDLRWNVKEDKVTQTDEIPAKDENSISGLRMNKNMFIIEDLKRLKKVERKLRQELAAALGKTFESNQVSSSPQEPEQNHQIITMNLNEEKLKAEKEATEKYCRENAQLKIEVDKKVQELKNFEALYDKLSKEHENLKASQASNEQKFNEEKERLEQNYQKIISINEEKLKAEKETTEKYSREKAQLEIEVDKKAQEFESVKASYEKLSKEYENLKSSKVSDEQKINEIKEALERNYQQSMNSNLENLRALNQEVQKYSDENNQLRFEADKKVRELKKIQIERDQLSEKYQKLQKSQLSQKFDEYRFKEILGQNQVTIGRKEEELREEKEKTENVSKENVQLRAEINEKAQELKNLQISFEQLSKKYQNLKSTGIAKEQKFKEIEQRLESERSRSEKLTTEFKEIERRLKNERSRAEILTSELKHFNEEINLKMNKQLEKLNISYNSLSNENHNLKAIQLSLESDITKATEKLKKEKECLEKMTVKYEQLRSLKQGERKSNSSILDELSAANMQIISINKQIENASKENVQLRAEIRRLKETIQKMDSAYQDLYRKYIALENRDKGLQKINEQKSREILNLRQSLETGQQELEKMEMAYKAKCDEMKAENRSNMRILAHYKTLVQADKETSQRNQALLAEKTQQIHSLDNKIKFLADENAKLIQKAQLFEAKYDSLKEIYDQLNASSWDGNRRRRSQSEPNDQNLLDTSIVEIGPVEASPSSLNSVTEMKTCPMDPICKAVFTRTRHLRAHIQNCHPSLMEWKS